MTDRERRRLLAQADLAVRLERAGRARESRMMWSRISFELRELQPHMPTTVHDRSQLLAWLMRYAVLALVAGPIVWWIHDRPRATVTALAANHGEADAGSARRAESRPKGGTSAGASERDTTDTNEGTQVSSQNRDTPDELPVEAPVSGRTVGEPRASTVWSLASSKPKALRWEPGLRCQRPRIASDSGERRDHVVVISWSATSRMAELGECRQIGEWLRAIQWRRTEAKAVAGAIDTFADCLIERSDDLQNAIDLLQEARCLDPLSYYELFRIGTLFLKLGEPARVRMAISELERLATKVEELKDDVYAARVVNAASMLSAEVGEFERAVIKKEYAHELDAGNESIAVDLAEFWVITGQTDRALALTERLLLDGVADPGRVPVLRAVRYVAYVQAAASLANARAELEEIIAWHRENTSVDASWTWKFTTAWLQRSKESGIDRRFDLSRRLIAALESPRAGRLSSLERLRSDLVALQP